jgi:hypothetical protein
MDPVAVDRGHRQERGEIFDRPRTGVYLIEEHVTGLRDEDERRGRIVLE